MASIYDLKPRFQNLLRPVCRALARRGVTPNQITVLAMAMSLAIGATIIVRPDGRWPLLLVAPGLLVRMALNALDGMLAREHDLRSSLGAFLNEIGDVVSDAALYLPLALVPGVDAGLAVCAVVLAVISELAGVVAVQVGTERRYDGPMGKSDRAAVFGLLTLLLGSGLAPGTWTTVVLGAVAALLVVTIVRRVRNALREAK